MRKATKDILTTILTDYPHYDSKLERLNIESKPVLTIGDMGMYLTIRMNQTVLSDLLEKYPDWLKKLIALVHNPEGESKSFKEAVEIISVTHPALSYKKARDTYNKFLQELARKLGYITYEI